MGAKASDGAASVMKPKHPTLRTKTVIFRVTEEEYDAVKREAWGRNMLMSAFVRAVILQKLGLEPKV